MRVFLLLFLSEILVLRVTSANKLRVQRQNLRVRISAVGDTIILKFIRPHVDTRLDGYILGYGNNMFSKQFIQLPENGQPYESEMDAEPKYLIAVQPVKADEPKKQCTGKVDLEKPLHVVIGSVTPSSVLLSWGTLLTTPFTESFLEDCIDEGQFTVRYREKEPRDTWNYQTCPTTSTVIDNLKPDAQYEFEVRADTKTSSGVWSPPVIHSTADQIIDEPYKELNQPKPEKPVLAVQQTFFPPAAVLNKTIPAPLIKHSNPMPKPRKTTGAGGLTAASLSPEDPSTSTQPPYSTHTPIVLPTPKTTIAAQPQKPTTQSSTPKQDPLTEQQHNGTTPKQPTTTEQQPSTTHLPSLPQQTSTLRQHSTTQQEISTTQHYTSTLETHSTTQQEISTTQYQISTLKQHSTTQQQPSTPQQYYHKTQVPTKDQPYTTQQQLSTTQQQLNETSNPKSTQSPITTKPPLPQTQQHTTNQVLPSTVQENPQTTKEQTTITQDSRHTGEIQTSTTLHRLSTTQRSRGTSKHQTYLSPISTSHSQFNTVTPSEQHPNTKPTPKAHTYMSTNIQSSTIPFFLQPSTLANRQDGLVTSQATGISKPLFSTKPPILKEHTTDYHSTTIKPPLAGSGQELTPEPVQPPTTFQYQPQPSTTKQQSSTAKQQASTAKYNRKTESQRENPLTNLKIESPGTPKNLSNPKPKKSKSFTKSDGFQNSPVAEKVTVRKNQPGGQMVPSQSKDEQLLSRPTLTNEVTNRNHGRGIFRNASSVTRPFARNVTHRLKPNGRVSPALPTNTLRVPPVYRNSTINKKRVTGGEHHIGLWSPKPPKGPRKHLVKTKSNQVSETKEKEKVIDLKQVDPVPFMKPLAPPTTEKPAYQEPTPTTTPLSAFNGSRFDTGDNSSVFSPHPVSEIDAMGKKRFVAPHVIYKTDKRPEEPCSVTHSLSFFPDEEAGYLNVTGPPKTAPSNLTVLTVEGCPSFVILDWEKTDNETTEYEVVSSTKGPHGEEEVSVLTTNQTHTAVENLKPESSYEFKVTPKNELGSGPASDAVTFNTESADPRVSEIPTGKNAIWSSFPFKADSYSECNGRQYIKRTWYRKFVGIQLCNSLRYKIYLSDSLNGKFYTIGDQTGHGEDHCQFVDSFLDGRTGGPLASDQLPPRQGFFRAVRQEPVKFGDIGGNSLINYVAWYECGIPIPGKW